MTVKVRYCFLLFKLSFPFPLHLCETGGLKNCYLDSGYVTGLDLCEIGAKKGGFCCFFLGFDFSEKLCSFFRYICLMISLNEGGH